MTDNNPAALPRTVAWPAALSASPFAALLLASGFLAHYLQDRRIVQQATLPGWYLPLRLRLTSVAVTSLLAGVFAV